MVAEGIDLSYLGIFNIWNNDLGKKYSLLPKNAELTELRHSQSYTKSG